MRVWWMAALTLAAACAGAPPERPTPVRVWAQPERALMAEARPFSIGARAPHLYANSIGSWTEPLQIRGTVVRAGALERGPLMVGSPEWLGMHELVVRHGSDRVVVQYDVPAGPVPVSQGERVRLFAHTMRVGGQLAFAMTVFDHDGALAMAGLHAPAASPELLPPGWWVDYGPVTRSVPLCDGRLAERAVRVRGPGGEAVVIPGWTSIARLGKNGSKYAVDVARSRYAEATCHRATRETGLSVVVRRIR